MRRITSTILEGRLKELNDATNSSFKLDHNSNYGGYSITIPVSGCHLVGRMPAREMYTYLQGALDWVTRPSFK